MVSPDHVLLVPIDLFDNEIVTDIQVIVDIISQSQITRKIGCGKSTLINV